MPQINRKPKSTINVESWDDFLDFSRWRIPDESVIEKRLAENALLFSGNYLWLWLIITIAYGLFINWRIIASALTIVISWHATSVLYRVALEESSKAKGTTTKKLGEKEDFSLPTWLKASYQNVTPFAATHLTALTFLPSISLTSQ